MKFIDTKRARSTDSYVTVYQLDHPVDDCSWGAECAEHGWIIYTPTRREAHAEARDPEAWCPECN